MVAVAALTPTRTIPPRAPPMHQQWQEEVQERLRWGQDASSNNSGFTIAVNGRLYQAKLGHDVKSRDQQLPCHWKDLNGAALQGGLRKLVLLIVSYLQTMNLRKVVEREDVWDHPHLVLPAMQTSRGHRTSRTDKRNRVHALAPKNVDSMALVSRTQSPTIIGFVSSGDAVIWIIQRWDDCLLS